MQNSAYIIGSSLVCNLGSSKEQIINNTKKITQENYPEYIKNVLKKNFFYNIEDFYDSADKRFYTILEYIVTQAIKEAQLSLDEQKDLTVFIGSTSMKISVDEVELKDLGYGIIGSFVEKLIKTQNKSIIFATACTSSANAFAYASKMIEQKKIKRALVIGLELFNKSTYDGFSSFMLLSKNKVYRPFDERSDGIILGEGCSAIVLDSKKKSPNNFRYVGSKNVCDIYSETTSNPSGEPIFNCMNEAIKDADLTLDDIDVIKAHATGSENNNSSEANAINLLFKEYKTQTKITALKPYIGHTLGACGTNEILLCLYCLEAGFIPPALGFEEPSHSVKFTPIKDAISVETKMTVLFNYVAFGGNNTSVILSNK